MLELAWHKTDDVFHGLFVSDAGADRARKQPGGGHFAMFICTSLALIFVHIYKTGGTSVTQALEAHFGPLGRRLHRSGRCWHGLAFRGAFHKLAQHCTAREIRDQLPDDLFAHCFKFAFVRNPWSLQLSLFRYVLRTPDHSQHADFAALSSFEAYVQWLETLPNGPHRVQCDFVMDEDGKPLLDFIGRFERLEQDFAAVADRFGWQPNLPHLNASGGDPDYRQFYTPRSRDIVARLHRADIETFGYDF